METLTFADADGDGWGGPKPLGELACVTSPPPGAAGNDLDCDDGDPAITGLVSRACPDALDASPEARVSGRLVGSREFVAFHGATPPARYTVAVDRCEGWAAEPLPAAREGHRGLATLQDSSELTDLPAWLDGLVGVGPGYAVFVDLAYRSDSDDWRWSDGTAPEGLPWCGEGPPTLEDFLIDLAPQDPERDALLEAIADDARLVLGRTAEGWCYGAPKDLGANDPQSASVFCERPAPNPVEYPTVVSE